MKKIYLLLTLSVLTLAVMAQANNATATATMKSSGRLFSIEDDLTSVIMIIPVDSTVTILGSDSSYYHVLFRNAEGFILKKQAVIDKVPVVQNTASNVTQPQQNQQTVQQQSRFSYLENKYGTSMAARLYSGKIWKGMNAQMVSDSWGSAQKINRVIDGNTIKEEWIYNMTWLYFENNTLLEWGAVKK